MLKLEEYRKAPCDCSLMLVSKPILLIVLSCVIQPPLLSLTRGNCPLPLHCGCLGTGPSLSHWCWTMWKTPISTADKSGRAAGVKLSSVDIPWCLMAPSELNGVCVTSGWQSCCWYQIEVVTSHFPRTFPLFPLLMFHLKRCQRSEPLSWSLIHQSDSEGNFVDCSFYMFR